MKIIWKYIFTNVKERKMRTAVVRGHEEWQKIASRMTIFMEKKGTKNKIFFIPFLFLFFNSIFENG